jgi:hypothetical protein
MGRRPEPNRGNERRDSVIVGLASLTGLQLHSANVESLPRELLGREVPDPDVLVRAYRDELEPRTHNALCQRSPGRPGEAWTVGRLLQIRGFGVHSLLDLLAVLARHAGPRSDEGESKHA